MVGVNYRVHRKPIDINIHVCMHVNGTRLFLPVQAMPTKVRTPQVERTAAMRSRLISAAKGSLMDHGYARTTAVEVCARAGVTRGALFHHFSGLPELFAATLEIVCADIGRRSRAAAEYSDKRYATVAYIET